jgi:glutamate carboxypeptidase
MRIERKWIAGLSCAVAGFAPASSALAPPDGRVLAAAQAERAGALDLLRQIVDIDSGTGDAAGAARVEAVLIPRLRALGAEVRTVPAEAPGLGDNLVATFDGTGRGRILIIAHIDTVYSAGTVAQRPFRIEGERAYGPGVSDEKGGVVTALTALKILHDLGDRDYRRITLLVETSEERGSPGTRHLIDSLVRDADVELNMEPGDAPDVITAWRKGSATYTIAV